MAALSAAAGLRGEGPIDFPSRGDRWVEVRTAHFTLFGDASESKTKEVGLEMEKLHAVLRALKSDGNVTFPIPTFIYVFKSQQAMEPMSFPGDRDSPLSPRSPGSPRDDGGGHRPTEINALLAVTLLEEAGYSCEVAPNGKAALEAVQARPFDLILMDVQMPVMDGLAATRRIREQELAGQRVPIVALTASAMTDEIAQTHEVVLVDDEDALTEAHVNNGRPVRVIVGSGAVLAILLTVFVVTMLAARRR